MATRSRLTSLLVVFGIALMAVAAVGAAASGAPGAPGPETTAGDQAAEESPPEATVQMAALQMSPRRLEIATGTTVNWVNGEPADYPVVRGSYQLVADDDSWESPTIAPGTRWTRRFDLPGDVKYRDTLHQDVTGEIVVTGEPILQRPAEQEVAITEPNPDDPTTWGFGQCQAQRHLRLVRLPADQPRSGVGADLHRRRRVQLPMHTPPVDERGRAGHRA
jgi:plastocyanin